MAHAAPAGRTDADSHSAGGSGPALSQAAELHRRGVAAHSGGHPQEAAAHFRAGLRLLGPAPTDPCAAAQAARILISLAHAEAEQGRVGHGLELLERAGPLAAAEDRGMLLSQRALLQWRAGRYRLALPLFDQAVMRLTVHPDPIALVKVLLNRGGLHMAQVRVAAARADLTRCEQVALKHGAYLQAAKAVNGLGYCELLVGNIPSALDLLARAEAGYREHGPGNVPITQVDRARALMAAGLAHEAVPQLQSAVAAFDAQHLTQDRADAELTLAQALAAAGDCAPAAEQARRAERHFRARDNETGATLAHLAATRADFDRCFGTSPPANTTASAGATGMRLARRADQLAGRLDDLGLARDAALARLISVRALLRSGTPPERLDERVRAALPRGISLPLETHLSAHLARAEVAIACGERGIAFTELRRGLNQLHTHRMAMGSLDLQTGVAALGHELTGAGLRLALAGGSPRTIFTWSERSRAQALRVRPVRPPDDPDTAEAVARLRYLDGLLHSGETDGLRIADVRQEHAELRRRLLEDSRATAAPGPAPAASAATLAEVIAELGDCGHRMISFLRDGDRLNALVIGDGRASLIALGDYARAAEAARRLAGDLDARTARCLPGHLEAVIDASIRRQIQVLTAETLAPLIAEARRFPDDGSPVVLIPTGALSAVPWGLLPDLGDRPLTVSPSAQMWLTARRSRPDISTEELDPRPLLVAGPRLAHAEHEIAAIARCYPAARTLTGSDATVEATLQAMNGARTVHLAAHGHHERGNVLFSRIDLVDGPLMAYDLQRLAAPPRLAVLSACEVGHADIRSGDEHLGFTIALLHTGTAAVISSSNREPDDPAPRLMTSLHDGLARGISPAAALAQAEPAGAHKTFSCYGAG